MQSESEVAQIQYLVFFYMVTLHAHSIPTSAVKPMKLGRLVPEFWIIQHFSKQNKCKRIFLFNWLYPKISICKYWLILLVFRPVARIDFWEVRYPLKVNLLSQKLGLFQPHHPLTLNLWPKVDLFKNQNNFFTLTYHKIANISDSHTWLME